MHAALKKSSSLLDHGAPAEFGPRHAEPAAARRRDHHHRQRSREQYRPWDRLQAIGVVLKIWPLNKDTLTLELDDLAPLMSDRTKLVCVTHVSNILGSVNPVRAIADFVHARGAKLCVDAVAYAPHRAVDVQAFDADYYVFSLYKTYGPHYALMYGKYELLLELDTLYHYFYGKDKVPGKLEPGNPNYELAYATCGIVDYLATLGEKAGETGTVREKIEAAYGAITVQEDALTERLLAYLRTRNDCTIVGQPVNRDSQRVPTIAFRFDGREAGELCKAMDEEQIAMRFGDFHSRRLAEYLGLTDHGACCASRWCITTRSRRSTASRPRSTVFWLARPVSPRQAETGEQRTAMRFDTVIRHATVVTASDSFTSDIGIKDGRIAALALGLTEADEVIDATGSSLCRAASTAMSISTSRPETGSSWPMILQAAPARRRSAATARSSPSACRRRARRCARP